MTGRLVIYGAGGFARDLIVAARHDPRELVFIDDAPSPDNALPLIGREDVTPEDDVVISVSDGAARRRIAAGFDRFGTLVAPTAVVGPDVVMGEGAIVCDMAMLVPTARIGRHFHLNVYSYVSHDCVIGDFVTFAPKVACNGGVHVGDGAYVGMGAVLKNGQPDRPLVIGRDAIVGMGAVVLADVPDGAVVVGNPARIVRIREDLPTQ